MGRPGNRARIVIDELQRAAGNDAVRAPAPGEYVMTGLTPRALVQPTSADATAAVLALCSEHGWSVEPAGAGSWLDHGLTTARQVDVVLSTARLSRRIEAEPGDLVVGADAGLPLQALQKRLRQDRQELPLDPPAADAATIGAVISHADAGPLRAASGTPRDYVLGLRVATGDGRLLRFGGRVVKNVAGYDVVRLLTGSRGTLGVITDAWLRLRALPQEERTVALDGAPVELLEVIAGLGVLRPAAAELLAPPTALAATGHAGWRALVRLRGGPEELADAARRIAGLAGGLGVTASGADVWTSLGRLEAAAAPRIRIAGRPAAAAATHALCDEFIAASGNELQDWHRAMHATVGLARLWPVRPLEKDGLQRLAGALAELRRRAEQAGGSVLVERAPLELQSVVSARGAVDAVTGRLEAELKREMDPAGILGSLA